MIFSQKNMAGHIKIPAVSRLLGIGRAIPAYHTENGKQNKSRLFKTD
jgi:hypothetical protein